MTDTTIEDLLKFDPLATAEKLTGRSYKEDRATSALGMLLAFDHNKAKESALRVTADSYWGMSFEDQLAVFASLGFEEVLRDVFEESYGPEEYVILWNPEGVLATCESYQGTDRNNADIYYNYRHYDGEYPVGLTSSGHMNGEVWVGNHDAREGVRYNLDAMRARGAFLSRWVERPWMWLLTYADVKVEGYDHEAITEERINRLPEHVRNAITPETEGK